MGFGLLRTPRDVALLERRVVVVWLGAALGLGMSVVVMEFGGFLGLVPTPQLPSERSALVGANSTVLDVLLQRTPQNIAWVTCYLLLVAIVSAALLALLHRAVADTNGRWRHSLSRISRRQSGHRKTNRDADAMLNAAHLGDALAAGSLRILLHHIGASLVVTLLGATAYEAEILATAADRLSPYPIATLFVFQLASTRTLVAHLTHNPATTRGSPDDVVLASSRARLLADMRSLIPTLVISTPWWLMPVFLSDYVTARTVRLAVGLIADPILTALCVLPALQRLSRAAYKSLYRPHTVRERLRAPSGALPPPSAAVTPALEDVLSVASSADVSVAHLEHVAQTKARRAVDVACVICSGMQLALNAGGVLFTVLADAGVLPQYLKVALHAIVPVVVQGVVLPLVLLAAVLAAHGALRSAMMQAAHTRVVQRETLQQRQRQQEAVRLLYAPLQAVALASDLLAAWAADPSRHVGVLVQGSGLSAGAGSAQAHSPTYGMSQVHHAGAGAARTPPPRASTLQAPGDPMPAGRATPPAPPPRAHHASTPAEGADERKPLQAQGAVAVEFRGVRAEAVQLVPTRTTTRDSGHAEAVRDATTTAAVAKPLEQAGARAPQDGTRHGRDATRAGAHAHPTAHATHHQLRNSAHDSSGATVHASEGEGDARGVDSGAQLNERAHSPDPSKVRPLADVPASMQSSTGTVQPRPLELEEPPRVRSRPSALPPIMTHPFPPRTSVAPDDSSCGQSNVAVAMTPPFMSTRSHFAGSEAAGHPQFAMLPAAPISTIAGVLCAASADCRDVLASGVLQEQLYRGRFQPRIARHDAAGLFATAIAAARAKATASGTPLKTSIFVQSMSTREVRGPGHVLAHAMSVLLRSAVTATEPGHSVQAALTLSFYDAPAPRVPVMPTAPVGARHHPRRPLPSDSTTTASSSNADHAKGEGGGVRVLGGSGGAHTLQDPERPCRWWCVRPHRQSAGAAARPAPHTVYAEMPHTRPLQPASTIGASSSHHHDTHQMLLGPPPARTRSWGQPLSSAAARDYVLVQLVVMGDQALAEAWQGAEAAGGGGGGAGDSLPGQQLRQTLLRCVRELQGVMGVCVLPAQTEQPARQGRASPVHSTRASTQNHGSTHTSRSLAPRGCVWMEVCFPSVVSREVHESEFVEILVPPLPLTHSAQPESLAALLAQPSALPLSQRLVCILSTDAALAALLSRISHAAGAAAVHVCRSTADLAAALAQAPHWELDTGEVCEMDTRTCPTVAAQLRHEQARTGAHAQATAQGAVQHIAQHAQQQQGAHALVLVDADDPLSLCVLLQTARLDSDADDMQSMETAAPAQHRAHGQAGARGRADIEFGGSQSNSIGSLESSTRLESDAQARADDDPRAHASVALQLVPIVALSSAPDKDEHGLYAAGVDVIVQKPAFAPAILQACADAVAQKQSALAAAAY